MVAKENLDNEERKTGRNFIIRLITFVNQNEKFNYILVGIAVMIGSYYAYNNWYLEPLQKDAQEQLFPAEQYFEKDSFHMALNGDGNNLGLISIIDEYSGTITANLAYYYAGISYLKLGEYENAIKYLSDFDTEDFLLEPISLAAIGDAYMNLNNAKEALVYFEDAIGINKNDFTTPKFLIKAGNASEKLEYYEKAKGFYDEIKRNYKNSIEGEEIDKHIARIELKLAQ